MSRYSEILNSAVATQAWEKTDFTFVKVLLSLNQSRNSRTLLVSLLLKAYLRTQIWNTLRVKKIVQSIAVYRIVIDKILSRKSDDVFSRNGKTVLNRAVRLAYIRRGWHKPVYCFLLTPVSDRFVRPPGAVDLLVLITYLNGNHVKKSYLSSAFRVDPRCLRATQIRINTFRMQKRRFRSIKRLNAKVSAVSYKSMQHVNVKQSREAPSSNCRRISNRSDP